MMDPASNQNPKVLRLVTGEFGFDIQPTENVFHVIIFIIANYSQDGTKMFRAGSFLCYDVTN